MSSDNSWIVTEIERAFVFGETQNKIYDDFIGNDLKHIGGSGSKLSLNSRFDS